jgi:hypothetical protein
MVEDIDRVIDSKNRGFDLLQKNDSRLATNLWVRPFEWCSSLPYLTSSVPLNHCVRVIPYKGRIERGLTMWGGWFWANQSRERFVCILVMVVRLLLCCALVCLGVADIQAVQACLAVKPYQVKRGIE